jgi:hypothetical protein
MQVHTSWAVRTHAPLWSKLAEVQGAPPSYGVNVRKFLSFRRSHSFTPSDADVARKYLHAEHLYVKVIELR